MKNRPIAFFRYKDLAYPVPESAEEFDQLAGRVGACVDEANSNIVYRGTLTSARDIHLHGLHEGEGDEVVDIQGLEELLGYERPRVAVTTADGKPKLDENGDPVMRFKTTKEGGMSEEEFYEHVITTEAEKRGVTVDVIVGELRPHAQAALDYLEFDPKRKERVVAGPKKTPKVYQEIADKLVAKGPEQAAKSANALTQKLGYTVEPTAEAIGRAIAEDKRRQRKAEQEKLQMEYA